MFTLIVLVLVVVFVVGALKSMSPSERVIVIRRSLNMITFGAVYLFRAGKGAATASYQSGRIAGTTLALEGQDALKAMKEHNEEVASKGGAAREAVRVSISHADALGLASLNKELKEKADALEAELEEMRKVLNNL
ncbi:MAG: hypothetical protein JHC33_12035 [Ignisphaera sp.]|nr:hypothetical protein [Ignisphaera sp.]